MFFRTKIYLLFVVCCLLFVVVNGQNLVPNPSFEDTLHCPTAPGQLNKTTFWINPNQGSPDYYSTCSYQNNNIVHIPNNNFGNQNAIAGNSYVGIYTFTKGFQNSREYLEVALTSTLVNHKYLVSFYVSLADSMQYSINTIGAYFSSTQISGTGGKLLSNTPQIQNKSTNQLTDKNNWQLISDTLYASGGEQYMTIGNFRPDSLSDTLFLGNGKFFSNYSYYYIDSVSVIDYGSIGIEQLSSRTKQLLVYPNPVNNYLSCKLQVVSCNLQIIDLLGNIVKEQEIKNTEEVIDVSALKEGIYFIQAKTSDGILTKKIIIAK